MIDACNPNSSAFIYTSGKYFSFFYYYFFYFYFVSHPFLGIPEHMELCQTGYTGRKCSECDCQNESSCHILQSSSCKPCYNLDLKIFIPILFFFLLLQNLFISFGRISLVTIFFLNLSVIILAPILGYSYLTEFSL